MFAKKKLRILMVGFGSMARIHATQLMQIRRLEFAGVVDTRPEGIEAARRFRVDVPVYHSLSEALASGRFDAAIISTPHHMHFEQSMQCLAGGVHVLSEKPVCLTMEEFDQLVAQANQSGRKLIVGQMMRYWSNVVWAKNQIQDGAIGEVRHVLRDRITQQSDAGGRSWAHNPAEAGGWLLYGTGVHEMDAILYMTGKTLLKAEAFACINNENWHDWDELSVCGHLSGGAVFSLNQTLNGGIFRVTTRIIGTRGSIFLDGEAMAMLNEQQFILGQSESFYAQLVAFARTIEDGQPNRAEIGDVRDTMAALDMIRRQIQSPAQEGEQA